jgi:hypothetical protein
MEVKVGELTTKLTQLESQLFKVSFRGSSFDE